MCLLSLSFFLPVSNSLSLSSMLVLVFVCCVTSLYLASTSMGSATPATFSPSFSLAVTCGGKQFALMWPFWPHSQHGGILPFTLIFNVVPQTLIIATIFSMWQPVLPFRDFVPANSYGMFWWSGGSPPLPCLAVW